MGSSSMPTFRVEYNSTPYLASGSWRVKDNGRPSTKNLAAHVERLRASFLPGGANQHIGALWGYDALVIRSARVVRQATGDVVATWEQ